MAIDVIGLLSTDGYVMCNKTIIKLYGTDCAVLLGELCAEYKYFEAREELTDGMFYSTQENIENNTGLSAHCQREAVKKLVDEGILYVEKRGMPAKNYYLLNTSQLLKIFTTSPKEFEEQVLQKFNLNNNKQTTINKNTILDKSNIVEETEETEFESHGYSAEDLKNEFLGSIKTKKKTTRKKSLYEKCSDAINNYTDDPELRTALLQYLSVRLAIKDKPIYGVNQWTALLNKLSSFENPVKIVEQSTEKGWCSFYPFNSPQKDTFSEGEGVYSEAATETTEERIEKLKRQGRRTEF